MRKINKILLFIVIFTFPNLFSQDECPENFSFASGTSFGCVPNEFIFIQSSVQAFYYIESILINGLPIEAEDWVGAFNDTTCVGTRKWSDCIIRNTCDVPIMGYDGNSFTEGQMNVGDVPTFKIYDASENSYYSVTSSNNYPWSPNSFNTINYLEANVSIWGCMDVEACNYNNYADMDDGSCYFAEENYDCDGNCILELDCFDICGGTALLDECGICDGDNSTCLDCEGVPNGDAIDFGCGCNEPASGECGCNDLIDLGCGCGEPAPSGCDNECGSNAQVDQCGVCNGDGTSCAIYLEYSVITNVNESELDDLETFKNNFELILESILSLPEGTVEVMNVTILDRFIEIQVEFIIILTDAELNETEFDSLEDILIALEIAELEIEDGIYDYYGCLNQNACNYNSNVTIDDGSCYFAEENYDCDGNCIESVDCLGNCGGTAVVDECGICAGFGAVYECGCSGLPLGACDCEGNIDLGCGCGQAPAEENYDCNGNCIVTIDCFGECGGSAEFDECLVCDGPGAIYECGCRDIPNGFCDCNGNILDECGVCGGPGFSLCWDNSNVCSLEDCPFNPNDCPLGTIYRQEYFGYDGICVPIEFADVNQSIEQASYFLTSVMIDNVSIDSTDWIGVFNNDICVGLKKWDNCSDGGCAITVFGYDGTIDTEGYMLEGELPEFKIYDYSENKYLIASTSEDYGWYNNMNFVIDSIYNTFPYYCLNLHSVGNLVSFSAIPENYYAENIINSLGNLIIGIISQGDVCYQESEDRLIGSGCEMEIVPEKGYWLILHENSEVEFCIENAISINYDVEYYLEEGANLISFPYDGSINVSDAVPDDVEYNLLSIISESTASINSLEGWIGSINSFSGNKGYWINSDQELLFQYDLGTLGRTKNIERSNKLINYEYMQSTNQAFYFIEEIEDVEVGDWILAYNGKTLIGTRQWTGTLVDVPVMGNDGNNYSKNYLSINEYPSFKLLKNGKTIDLIGEVQPWSNNMIHHISKLYVQKHVPNKITIQNIYPNPFNPTTSITFIVPITNHINLSIYDIYGKEVMSLVNKELMPGVHSIDWNASNFSSGIYFARLFMNHNISTQKLILIK